MTKTAPWFLERHTSYSVWVRSDRYESGFHAGETKDGVYLQLIKNDRFTSPGVFYRSEELRQLVLHCPDWAVIVDWLIENSETPPQREVSEWLQRTMPR